MIRPVCSKPSRISPSNCRTSGLFRLNLTSVGIGRTITSAEVIKLNTAVLKPLSEIALRYRDSLSLLVIVSGYRNLVNDPA